MTKKIKKAHIDAITAIYEEIFDVTPSSYEMAIEKHFVRALDVKDWDDLNRQTERYNAECGVCTTRQATQEELTRARR